VHTPPSREKRESPTYDLAPCIGASGRGFDRPGDTRGQDCLVPSRISSIVRERDITPIDLSPGQDGRPDDRQLHSHWGFL
jgi:hypothetical protein